MTTPQRRLQLLHANAPSIYIRYISHRKSAIKYRLEELRVKYRNASEPEKEWITNEATELKQELALYE